MPSQERILIEGESDKTPYHVYRVNAKREQIKCVGKYATEDEARKHPHRQDWSFGIYLHGRRKIS